MRGSGPGEAGGDVLSVLHLPPGALDDSGDVLGGQAVEVEMYLGGPFDRDPLRRWEAPCGPGRHA
jgi:hypothetical protein